MEVIYTILCQWCDYETVHDGMAARHLKRHYHANKI